MLLGCPAEEALGGALASASPDSLEVAGAEASGPAVWPRRTPDELPWPDPDTMARRVSVYLDAGHGAADNSGNSSCFCVREQDFTYALADDVAATLEESGRFWVVGSRAGDRLVAYGARVDEAAKLQADVFVSLHSDVRGKKEAWSPEPALTCQRATDAPGFSVLYSDEGEAPLVSGRLALAERVAADMIEAGFLPYGGAEYAGLYEGAQQPGVFVDRHEPKKRIFVLRRPTMPSIIVETHNALDPREASLWEDAGVRRSFALALGRAVLEVVR